MPCAIGSFHRIATNYHEAARRSSRWIKQTTGTSCELTLLHISSATSPGRYAAKYSREDAYWGIVSLPQVRHCACALYITSG
jgi:hypothetical protein